MFDTKLAHMYKLMCYTMHLLVYMKNTIEMANEEMAEIHLITYAIS